MPVLGPALVPTRPTLGPALVPALALALFLGVPAQATATANTASAQPDAGDLESDPTAPEATGVNLATLDTTLGGTTPEGRGQREIGFDIAEQLGAGSGVRLQAICTNCNAASLTVNGLSGHRVRVDWDGLPTAGGLATVYYLTQFPSELIGHSTVHRGPGSVLTGAEGIAGQISFHPAATDVRRGFLEMQAGSAAYRTLRLAGGDSKGPVSGLVFLQGARSGSIDTNGDGFNEIARFERFTAHGFLNFRLSDRDDLSLSSLFYGENQLDGPGAPWYQVGSPTHYMHEDVAFHWRQHGLRWRHARPSGLEITLEGRYSLRVHQQWALPTPTADEQQRTVLVHDERPLLRFTVARPAGNAGFITAGAGMQRYRLALHVPDDRSNPYYMVDGLEHDELFFQYDRSVSARWDYSIGVRHDRFTVFGKSSRQPPGFPPPDPLHETAPKQRYSLTLPRGEVHFRPAARVVLGLAAGRGAVGPLPVYEETCCGAKYQRNLDLLPERSWSYQGTIEFKPNPDSRFTTTLFHTDVKDYHERIVYKTEWFIPYYSNANLPRARIQGIDFVHDLRFAEGRYNVGWTYTYVDAKDQEGRRIRYTPRHEASAYFRYSDPRRGLTASLDARYKGDVLHFRLEEFRSEDEPWEFLKSENFTGVDVRLEKTVGRRGWSVLGGIVNLTDYAMPDLGKMESAFDWGPIQGRFVFAGMKFVHERSRP